MTKLLSLTGEIGNKYVFQAHLSKNLLIKAYAVSLPRKEIKGGVAPMRMIKHEFCIIFWYSCDYIKISKKQVLAPGLWFSDEGTTDYSVDVW